MEAGESQSVLASMRSQQSHGRLPVVLVRRCVERAVARKVYRWSIAPTAPASNCWLHLVCWPTTRHQIFGFLPGGAAWIACCWGGIRDGSATIKRGRIRDRFRLYGNSLTRGMTAIVDDANFGQLTSPQMGCRRDVGISSMHPAGHGKRKTAARFICIEKSWMPRRSSG